LEAQRAEREIMSGSWRGPLHGIPYSLKDLFETKKIRTTAHSRVLADWVPLHDAACVQRMEAAGAVLIGKTALQEFATGAVDEGPWPAARNPWNTDYTPSGSTSGGAVAVASDLGFVAIGSDTAGSIRTPAGATGCVGLRPTLGRVSCRGALPLAPSFDTCGPIARTVRDCAAALQAIAGYDAQDPVSVQVEVPDFAAELEAGIQGLRLGFDPARCRHNIEASVASAFENALDVFAKLGAKIVELPFPNSRHVHAALNIMHLTEAHAVHGQTVKATPMAYGATARAYFRLGAFVTASDYQNARRIREAARAEMLGAFKAVDVLIAPTSPKAGERFDAIDTSMRFRGAMSKSNFAIPFSAAGIPAISIPCGMSEQNLPIGLQIAAAPFNEAMVFRAAHAFERATTWHTLHPNLAR
jgi:aspartyl-tRNA(Asn)/glutamyl-tRNA(Gln) amidotransferase subunit A